MYEKYEASLEAVLSYMPLCTASRTDPTRAKPPRAVRDARKSRVFNFSTDVYMTNEFVIRDSTNFSNDDKHLASPSNDSLTPVGSCSVRLRIQHEMRITHEIPR